MMHYYIQNYFRKPKGIDREFDQLIIYYLCQSINNNKNQVIDITFPVGKNTQPYDKIYRQIFPPMRQYWQRLEVTIGLVSHCFQRQTDVTPFDVPFDVMIKHLPIIFPSHKFPRFFDSKVAYQRIVVLATDQLCTDNFWCVWEHLVVKYPINVFLTFFQPFRLHFLSSKILALQFLQPQPHTTNADPLKLFVSQLIL